MNWFVSGFGAFLDVQENPSKSLALELGYPCTTLDVRYEAVDNFLRDSIPPETTHLLHLGVARRASTIRIETLAQNRIGPTPDVDGVAPGPAPIDLRFPPNLHSTLFTSLATPLPFEGTEWSVDAGDYLSNYILFESLRLNPHLRVGFIHVPPFEAIPQEKQLDVLRAICHEIEEAWANR